MRHLIFIILMLLAAQCHAQVITTFAGNGAAGFAGDGLHATEASLHTPGGVAADANGNVYITDLHNNRVRKVNAQGIISTYAGGTASGYNGDGIAATAAGLNAPWGVAADGAGNLYIADAENNRIRMVAAGSGVVTTVAGNGFYGYSGDGGAATLAQLSEPNGVAIDAHNNLYIADYDNNCVRKVNAAGIISTFAGSGRLTGGYSGDGGPASAAQLWAPTGVAVDGGGNVYIADEGNNCIRIVNAAGVIGTFAGRGAFGFAGDGGPPTAALLNAPNGVAADFSGNVYIADNANNRLRKVSGGIINTIAGDGVAGFSGDGGPGTAAALYAPWGVTVDAANNVYIADAENNRVRIITCFSTALPPISGVDSICAGAVIALHDSFAGGVWHSGDSLIALVDSAKGIVTGLSQGSAMVTYSTKPNIYGCVSSTSYPIVVTPPFAIDATVIAERCYGSANGSIQINSPLGSGYRYYWSGGDSTAEAFGLAPGSYRVYVKDTLTQCAASDSFLITTHDSVTMVPAVVNDACHTGNGSVAVSATGGTPPFSFLWADGKTGAARQALTPGNYYVTATDSNGCSASLQVQVGEDTCRPVVIHDVITPNGDGINDSWVVEGLEYYQHNLVQIFDKWGSRVFYMTDYDNKWSGKSTDGSVLPDGTYYYLVKLNAPNGAGGEDVFTGALLIKR